MKTHQENAPRYVRMSEENHLGNQKALSSHVNDLVTPTNIQASDQ